MNTEKNQSYENYLLVKKMTGLTLAQKTKVLSDILFLLNSNPWRIVGITEDALDKFKSNNFKLSSRMGINRSHIKQRHQTYSYLLSNDLDIDTFWDKFWENDKTILSTSSENMSDKFSKIIDLNPTGNQFMARGYNWRHTKEEAKILRDLYHNYKKLNS